MTMNSEIYIRYMTDEMLDAIKKNITTVVTYMDNNKLNNDWLDNLHSGKKFQEMNFRVPDFDLQVSPTGDYKEVEFENSLKLYHSLKHLPKYVLSDERFWAWLNFEKCYEASLQSLPINGSKSRVKNHYLFSAGNRRGLFFGVMSRSFYRVALTIEEDRKQKYDLTEYVIDNPQRFRELSWRSFSSRPELVRGALHAQRDAEQRFGKNFKSTFYPQIAKFISRIGGIKLLDAMPVDYIYEQTYQYIEKLISKEREDA